MPEYTPPFCIRQIKTHVLKCDAEPYAAVALGFKRAEFRNNDRGFQNADGIMLHEYIRGKATGRTQGAIITHIQTGYGIPDGYVMLSLHLL